MTSRAWRAELLLLLTALIWGSSFVAQRVGMDHVRPFTYNGARFLLGALSLLPLFLIRRPSRPLMKPDSGSWLFVGSLLAGLILFAGASLQQIGIVHTTAGKAGFITGLYVVIVPLLGLLWGHRTPWKTWAGVGLAVAGLYLLTVTDAFTLAQGDGLVLIGAFFWAGHVLIIGWLSGRHIEPVQLACGQCAVCAVLSLGVAAVIEPIQWQGLQDAALPILYGGLLSVGVAYTLQVVAQRDAPPAHAAIILSLETVFAALSGWLLLNETLAGRGILGCVLMFAGMLLSQLSLGKAAPPPTEPALVPTPAPMASAATGDPANCSSSVRP
ncbi:MAG: DMT family transporter [Candidatus Competibacteraceae bacterium]|nr:DMT family transporter [Candidatus Competibacteraceae bacterium]